MNMALLSELSRRGVGAGRVIVQNIRVGGVRPTAAATIWKRSLTVPPGGMTVEVSHRPSRAAQPRALDGGHDGQPVALVIRARLGANLRPRDRAFCGRGVSRIQRRCAQTGRAANSQRHGARQPSLKQVEFGFHDYVLCCVDISPQTPPRKYGFITPTAWTCSSCPCQYFNGSLAILLSYGWPNGLVVTVRY